MNNATEPALTPSLDYGSVGEFQADQQKQIAQLIYRVTSLESRHNGQHKRIGEQEKFIATLKTEGAELRKRVRFLENTEKLKVGQA